MTERDILNDFEHLKEDAVNNVQTRERLDEIIKPGTARRRLHPAWAALAGAAAVAILVGGVVLAFRPGASEPVPPATSTLGPSTTLPPTTTLPPSSTTAVPLPTTPTNVTLYFLDAEGHLVPVGRVVDAASDSSDRVVVTLRELFAGPSSDDVALVAGLATALPRNLTPPGLTTYEKEGIGTADVIVSADFAAADRPAVAQIVYTVTQFEGLERVTFITAGGGEPPVLSDGTRLDAPFFSRDGLADFLAPIFVDQPPVNGVVGSPFTIRGVADFSTDIGYELLGENLAVIASGSIPARCEVAGCVRQLVFDVAYELPQVEVGWVSVFAVAADGSRLNEVRHLVTIEATPGGTPVPVDPFQVEVDVAVSALPLVEATPQSVVAAGWGSSNGQLGRLDGKDFGPCCFDVAPDGRVVVADSQNQRIVVYSDPDDLWVLATFDPADFVPDAVATDGTLVYVLGLTNRRGGPIDLIGIDLDLGTEVFRSETSLDINVDLRVTAFGVFAGIGGAAPQWIQLADSDGLPIPAAEQVAYPELPSETTIATTFTDATVSIAVRPAGDSPTTVYRIPTDGMSFDVVSWPAAPDANGIAVWMTPDLSGAAPSTVMVLGTDGGELAGRRIAVTVPRAVEVGPFNTFRYAYGGLYLMTTTDNGVEILRYELR